MPDQSTHAPRDTALGCPPAVGDVDWLRDVKIVEVTTAVSAPLIGRVLAQMGAEVVKVESRAKVDVNRARVPRPTDPEGFPAHEAFQLLHEANAGKDSVTLNLKTDRGKELLLELLGDADVFIENFVPGWLDRLGLSVAELRERFPHLIILSASGYGQTGPMRTQRSYAPVMTALAGVEKLIGYEDGEVMGCSALALADLNCTFSGVFLVMSALTGRRTTGHGVHIDVSQIEAASMMAGEAFVAQQRSGDVPGPVGNVDPDGSKWTLAQIGDDCWLAARGDGAEDALSEWTSENDDSASPRPTKDEILSTLRRSGIEASPVLSPVAVVGDPRFDDRGFTQKIDHPHPAIGELTITSVPWRVSGIVPRVTTAAPLLGSSNERILGRYVSTDELADLQREGVLK